MNFLYKRPCGQNFKNKGNIQETCKSQLKVKRSEFFIKKHIQDVTERNVCTDFLRKKNVSKIVFSNIHYLKNHYLKELIRFLFWGEI